MLLPVIFMSNSDSTALGLVDRVQQSFISEHKRAILIVTAAVIAVGGVAYYASTSRSLLKPDADRKKDKEESEGRKTSADGPILEELPRAGEADDASFYELLLDNIIAMDTEVPFRLQHTAVEMFDRQVQPARTEQELATAPIYQYQQPPVSQYIPPQEQYQYPPPQRPHKPYGYTQPRSQSPPPKPQQQQPVSLYIPPQKLDQYPSSQRPHKPYGYTQPRSQSPPPKPHPVEHHPEQDTHLPQPPPQHRSDLNQINKHNEHYMSLRTRANQEGDLMAWCFEQSREAYSRMDRARAKELSNEGQEHKRKAEKLNLEASEWIFAKNNEDSAPGEIDLHGLCVKEAIFYANWAVEDAKRRGDSYINFIVGKGLHAFDGVAKLRPVIKKLMQKRQLLAELDPENAGVLIVQLNGRTGRRQRNHDRPGRNV